MALLETILALWGTAIGSASAAKDLQDFLSGRVSVEQALADLIEEAFHQHLPRLQHLCPDGKPEFRKGDFIALVESSQLHVRHTDDFPEALLPLLRSTMSTPGATCPENDFSPAYKSILNSAVRGMWKYLSRFNAATNEILLRKGDNLEAKTEEITVAIAEGTEATVTRLDSLEEHVTQLSTELKEFTNFAQNAFQQYYNELLDTAPPKEHRIDRRLYENPFLLARSEDFNHNYGKLARLFQKSPEWDSIQRRTDNVFLEGGRGTGKSMLLRRLTAQATIAAARIKNPTATYDDVEEDYFGVYLKLTRGYYEQFLSVDTVNSSVSTLLAQHELNIEVFDAFVDTMKWLWRHHALPVLDDHLAELVHDLNALFPRAPRVERLEDLRDKVVKFEQDQINAYYCESAFGNAPTYIGSAQQTVSFLRTLSKIFRDRLFPNREIRLFLLIDEFETLVELQQVAINTALKMRLPDLTLKIGVRKSGRKTFATFTGGDPIQDPRDFTDVPLDYDPASQQYIDLLRGIAEKRLTAADYRNHNINDYLPANPHTAEVTGPELEDELVISWNAGQRRSESITDVFRQHAGLAAVYRVLSRKGKRKSYCGFEQYALLSSGIVSNFIELCKYAFFFALSDELPLEDKPQIPSYLQTDAAYAVSHRLFATLDGNVPDVGFLLKQLVGDLGRILRSRLLRHPSEPEANRFEVTNYAELQRPENQLVAKVIASGVTWSALHLEGVGKAFLPKNASRPANAQLVINRIYCPALGISPRSRWRVRITVKDLADLIDSAQRDIAYKRLSRSLGGIHATEGDAQKPLPLMSQ